MTTSELQRATATVYKCCSDANLPGQPERDLLLTVSSKTVALHTHPRRRLAVLMDDTAAQASGLYDASPPGQWF